MIEVHFVNSISAIKGLSQKSAVKKGTGAEDRRGVSLIWQSKIIILCCRFKRRAILLFENIPPVIKGYNRKVMIVVAYTTIFYCLEEKENEKNGI